VIDMKTKRDIGDVILNIILFPFYLVNLGLQLLCLATSPLLLLGAMYSIPIDILLYPFSKTKWKATKWLYEEFFMLVWDDTIRDIKEIKKRYIS
jgi:hypothetical protein